MKLRLLVATVLVALPLGLGLSGILSSDERPAEPQAAPGGPFRGGHLPDGLRGSRAIGFELTDARGGTTGTGDVRGKPYVLTFLFTDCPDVCPMIGGELRRALELLGPAADDAAVLAVSVDPKGDTPAAARDWLDRHRLPPNFHYLIGPERRLKPVWDSYYAAPQIPGRADSAHTASIWLIDGNGRIRTKFSGGMAVPPEDIAHDLRLLIDEARRS